MFTLDWSDDMNPISERWDKWDPATELSCRKVVEVGVAWSARRPDLVDYWNHSQDVILPKEEVDYLNEQIGDANQLMDGFLHETCACEIKRILSEGWDQYKANSIRREKQRRAHVEQHKLYLAGLVDKSNA